jgi:hypothetical protein
LKIYQTYLLKLIKTNNIQNIEYLDNLVNGLKIFNDISKVIYLEKITDKLYYKIDDFEKFFEIINIFVNNLLKSTFISKSPSDKLNSELFDNKLLEESSEKFVSWLLL